MRIIRDTDLATLTLVPVEAGEEEMVKSIIEKFQPDERLDYGGRSDDETNGSCIVYFYAGSKKEEQIETEDNVTIIQQVHVGGIKLTLVGSSKEDKCEVGRIRDTCYFGSGGLIFLGDTEVDGKKAIVVTVMLCKHCGAGMIDMGSCEWETCKACSEKCDHNYVRGAIHGSMDIGIGEFCDKCGRGEAQRGGRA